VTSSRSGAGAGPPFGRPKDGNAPTFIQDSVVGISLGWAPGSQPCGGTRRNRVIPDEPRASPRRAAGVDAGASRFASRSVKASSRPCPPPALVASFAAWPPPEPAAWPSRTSSVGSPPGAPRRSGASAGVWRLAISPPLPIGSDGRVEVADHVAVAARLHDVGGLADEDADVPTVRRADDLELL